MGNSSRSGWMYEIEQVHPRWFLAGIAATIAALIWLLIDVSPLPILLLIGGVSWTVLALVGHYARGRSY